MDFPRAKGKESVDGGGGWVIDPSYLRKITDSANDAHDDEPVSWEQCEAVLLALERLRAAQPAVPAECDCATVPDICNAYESGVGHAGRPTASVNPYPPGTPQHTAYEIGASGGKHNAQPAVPANNDDTRLELLRRLRFLCTDLIPDDTADEVRGSIEVDDIISCLIDTMPAHPAVPDGGFHVPTLEAVLRGLKSEDDSTQLRAIISEVETMLAASQRKEGA